MASCVCGADRWIIKERLGDLETWECGVCGRTELVSVARTFRDSDFPPSRGRVFLVAGYWLSKPTPERIAAVKRRFPHLSGQVLAQHARLDTSFELGRFAEADLPGFEAIVAEFGIGLRVTPLGGPQSGGTPGPDAPVEPS
jgi:hypothetical protein